MPSSEEAIRVAILGVRGIGQVHAKVFRQQGAKIVAILGSSKASAHQGAQEISGPAPQAFFELDRLLEEAQPQALSVCTPHHLHAEQILRAFEHNLPVFCEKPLYWPRKPEITRAELEEILATILNHTARRLWVNTSNTVFLDVALGQSGMTEDEVQSFTFRFYTRGGNRGQGIGVDLVPHGFAMLLRLFGVQPLSGVREEVSPELYQVSFRYGDCNVLFDFGENPSGPKAFSLVLNGREFHRIQKGDKECYRVYLQQRETPTPIEVKDPFQVYIAEFLDACRKKVQPHQDRGIEAGCNLLLMARLFLP